MTSSVVYDKMPKGYDETRFIATMSIMSSVSALCFFCIFSFASLVSVGSLGGVASIMSVLSVNSFASILSVNSVFSVGCVNSYMKVCFGEKSVSVPFTGRMKMETARFGTPPLGVYASTSAYADHASHFEGKPIPQYSMNCPGTMSHFSFYTDDELGGPTVQKDGTRVEDMPEFGDLFDSFTEILATELRLGIDAKNAVEVDKTLVGGASGLYLGYSGPQSPSYSALVAYQSSPLTFGADLTNKKHVMWEQRWRVLAARMWNAEKKIRQGMKKACHQTRGKWLLGYLIYTHISKVETVLNTTFTNYDIDGDTKGTTAQLSTARLQDASADASLWQLFYPSSGVKPSSGWPAKPFDCSD